jgi:catechol 2,3-dioxygenase-like lactoylglutathione lyase family enzyme
MTDAEPKRQRVVFNHVGLCVTDLERSRQFYENVLDFQHWWELDAPDEGTSALLRIPQPVDLHAVYLVRDGLVLELLHYRSAGARDVQARVMNEPGLTHLSLAVDDIAGALSQVPANGGTVVEETDIKAAIMIRDPDGQLIELTTADWANSLPPRPDQPAPR